MNINEDFRRLSQPNYHNLCRKLLFLCTPEEMRCLRLFKYSSLKKYYMLYSEISKGFFSEKTPCSAQYHKTFSFLLYVVLDFYLQNEVSMFNNSTLSG